MADQEQTEISNGAENTSSPAVEESAQVSAETPDKDADQKSDAGEAAEKKAEDVDGGAEAEEAKDGTAGTRETVTGEDGEKPPKEGDKPEGEEGEKSEGKEGETTEGEEGETTEGEPAKKAEGEKDEIAEGEEGGEPDGEGGEKKSGSPIPQSDTFAEGERPESPHRIGTRLSREGSPVDDVEMEAPDKLEPGTPERSTSPVSERVASHVEVYDDDDDDDDEEEEEDEDEEEEEIKPTFDREALIEQYHAALAEREQLQQSNHQLQHKLAEYFRKKKADESRQDYDKNVTDQEQRYLKYMAQLEDLRRHDMYERDGYKQQIEELQVKCEDKKDRVDKEREKFIEFKKHVALNAINSRSGKPIPQKDIEQYLLNENKKEMDVVNVRLENIKLKNKLKKKEQYLKSKEELAEGLHLIDFEQLKIENQTYNEKIEERNEELLKLRKKITSTVQVLTHLKEKLQYVQAENQVQKTNLRDVEATVAQKRDVLSRTKQARDALRIDNQKLRQSCGLLGNEPLLRDFEERKDEGDDLRERLERMKMLHAELTLNCNQVRRKIDQARAGRS